MIPHSSGRLIRLRVCNFRSLADVGLAARALNVLFGPNGAGKSSILDTIRFVHDCAVDGVDAASSYRGYGIGALWDQAEDGANISIHLETESAEYEVALGYSAGRIEPFAGETLRLKGREVPLLTRKAGSNKATFFDEETSQTHVTTLREAERLALIKYLDLENSAPEALEMDQLLRSVKFYHSRGADFHGLKRRGSEAGYQDQVRSRFENLWSVLRNLHDRRAIDGRYDTILDFMRESFPSFKDLLIEQTGPDTVYGSIIERGRRRPIPASGISDGHLQMLTQLTALFAEGKDRTSLILLDEPEISLHPYGLAVFAKAAKIAVEEWNRQIFIATHSPVLISQFEPEEILAVEVDESGRTTITRVSEIADVHDLLAEYAAGSLYMSPSTRY